MFKNDSERYPESNGFYVVQVNFNNVSWAASNGFTEDDHFGSADVRRN